MASFQAKIGWKMPRKRKNKNYQSVPFRSYTTLFRSSKEVQRIKKYHYGFLPSQNRLENAEKERI